MAKLRECIIAWEEVKDSGQWSVLAFDGVLRESKQGSVQVTSYPVDSGFMVSDHAIRQNRIIEINSITSNFSMSVATSRKSFEATFNELMTLVSATQQGAPVYELGEIGDGITETENGAIDNTYAQATKYGRPKYDNKALDVKIPFTDLTLITLTDPITTSLGGQVSLDKVDETARIIDELNARGQLVHLVTMRGIWTNCVLRQYSMENDVSNSYSLPCALVFEQLNVIDIPRSEMQVVTKNSTGEEAAEDQSKARQVRTSAQTFRMLSVQSFGVMEKTTPSPPVLLAETPFELTEEFTSLEHKEVPFSTKFDTRFVYNETEYTLGRLRYNHLMQTWVTALQWRNAGEYVTAMSIPIVAGVDLVQQYNSGLPSLVAVNIQERGLDPEGPESLRLYIIEEFHELFRR